MFHSMSQIVAKVAILAASCVAVAKSAADQTNDILVYITDSLFAIKPLFHLQPLNLNTTATMNNTHIFGFESLFESRPFANTKRAWMERNWHWSILVALCYMLLVLLGTNYMKSRPRYELRFPLFLWSSILAVFSCMGAFRVIPDFVSNLESKGLEYSVCNNDYAYGISGFWAYMFVLSKLPELVDTVFIVLRKQKLIFLHWYHHATVLIYCWYSYKDFTSSGRWFMTMNYFVHSLMYSYYALKAMRIHVPRGISQLITVSQIVQMMAGIGVNVIAWQTKQSGKSCTISNENIAYSTLMYASYFGLFAHFFLNAYVFTATSKQKTFDVKKAN